MSKTLTLPKDQIFAQLDLHDGARVTAEVRGELVHLTVFDEEPEFQKNAGKAFLKKWAGVLKGKKFKKESYADDPRMLYYMDKYQLDQ